LKPNKYDGEPAFPFTMVNRTGANLLIGSAVIPNGGEAVSFGMTLRDYFAAKALAACIAEPVEGVAQCVAFELSETTAADFAKAAYRFADAMLKEREK
jgi:hypothetical protein